jgi:pyruvate formate lyase activating enzyme
MLSGQRAATSIMSPLLLVQRRENAMNTLSNVSIKGFIETSFVDWPGKICSVIFFPRCNFRCRYCHNADLILRPETFEDIEPASIGDRLRSLRGWIDGVCVTGGEPTLHSCLPDVLSAIKRSGVQAKLDTNGSNPDILADLIKQGLVDYVAMDVKSSLDENSYCKIIQTPNMLESVKKSVSILLSGSVEYEFRVTVVPQYHGPEDIYALARELNGAARLRVQNFSPSEHVLDPAFQTLSGYTEEDIELIQSRVDMLVAESRQVH